MWREWVCELGFRQAEPSNEVNKVRYSHQSLRLGMSPFICWRMERGSFLEAG